MNKNKIGTVGPSDQHELEVVKKAQQSKLDRIKRAKQYGLAVLCGVSISIIGIGGFKIGKWFETNKIVFHSPIEIQFFKPVVLVNRESYKQEQEMAHQTAEIERLAIEQYLNPDKLPKCSAEVMEKIDPKIFWETIWDHESTNGKATSGKHIACRNKGKWNEIGYSPSTNFCFNSKEEAQLYVPYYVSNKCNGMTLNECLCYWNEGAPDGKVRSDCPYAKGQLSLAN